MAMECMRDGHYDGTYVEVMECVFGKV